MRSDPSKEASQQTRDNYCVVSVTCLVLARYWLNILRIDCSGMWLWCLLLVLWAALCCEGLLLAPTAWLANRPSRGIQLQNTMHYSKSIPKPSIASSLLFRTSSSDVVDENSPGAGMDLERVVDLEDEEEVEEDEEVEEFYDSKVLSVMSKTVFPLSISVGFAAVPSGKLALRFAGAAMGGLVGLAARSAIRTYARKPIIPIDDGDNGSGGNFIPDSVHSTINQLVSSPTGLLGQTVLTIERTAKRNNVPEKELGLLFTTVFSKAVFNVTALEGMDLIHLVDVMNFAEVLKLTEAEIGDGLALAAIQLGKSLPIDELGFYNYDEFPVGVLDQGSKLLFLADKLIGVDQGYYGRRMIPALSYFLLEEYKSTLTEACKQVFRNFVDGVLVEPSKYQRGEVDALKRFLEVSSTVSDLRPAVMQHMIYEAIQDVLNRTIPVDASPMTAVVQHYDNYLAAQHVLGGDSTEWAATLEARTMPLFESAVRNLFTQVIENPDRGMELAKVLQKRVDSLKIDPSKARALIATLMSEQNNLYMNSIDRVYNASGGAVEPAYKMMVSYAHTHTALKILTEPVMIGTQLPLPGLPFTDMVRANIYQAQLTKAGGKLENQLPADMFALSPEQRQLVQKHLALPKLVSWVKKCIDESNFSSQARDAFFKQCHTNGVTEEEWAATAVDFYYQEAQRVAQSCVVPTQEEMFRLVELSKFLNCSSDSVAKVHLELFAQKYIKALSESMTPTGVITEEYVEGLFRLRQRLGLEERYADVLFSIAARERISPIVKDLVDIWKSDTDTTYRAEKEKKKKKEKDNKSNHDNKDKSRDPISSPNNVFGFMESESVGQKVGGGPNVFMREALNLVDFLTENHKLLNAEPMEQLDHIKVNAGGMVSEEDLTGMFKHYALTRLIEQDPVLAERYSAVEKMFGKVLGLSDEGQGRAKESLAYTLCKNFLMRMLQNEETIGPQFTAHVVQFMRMLNLDADVIDRVLKEATKGAMVEHTAKIIRATADGKPLTPDGARSLRMQMESLGLHWRTDVGFSDALITYLYSLEVQHVVEGGEGPEKLAELMSTYGIPADRAEAIVEATCKRYVSQLLNLALRAAKKYDERETVHWVINILQYAPYISGAVDADGNLFEEEDRDRLIAFYNAEAESGENAQLIELSSRVGDVKAKLRDLIHLTEDFVAPEQGIEGLLGNVKSLAQLETDVNVDEGRKTWAWG